MQTEEATKAINGHRYGGRVLPREELQATLDVLEKAGKPCPYQSASYDDMRHLLGTAAAAQSTQSETVKSTVLGYDVEGKEISAADVKKDPVALARCVRFTETGGNYSQGFSWREGL